MSVLGFAAAAGAGFDGLAARAGDLEKGFAAAAGAGFDGLAARGGALEIS